jgi:hypothetical protein
VQTTGSSALSRVFTLLCVLLIGKVTLSVVMGYRHYFPPNFESDFLLGREAYFWGVYRWAFYAHLVSGPASLLLGTVLVSERFRRAAPLWHRRLGRAQAALLLLLLVPSGLWMARYAATGAIAAWGLGSLAIATAACVLFGWKAAVERRFADHGRWMGRTYVLLISAVVIRLIGGLATVTAFDALWLYPLSCWISWLMPLAVFETIQMLDDPAKGRLIAAARRIIVIAGNGNESP